MYAHAFQVIPVGLMNARLDSTQLSYCANQRVIMQNENKDMTCCIFRKYVTDLSLKDITFKWLEDRLTREIVGNVRTRSGVESRPYAERTGNSSSI